MRFSELYSGLGPSLFYPFAERYTKRQISPKLKELQTYRQLHAGERARLRRERILDTLQYAAKFVPYYRDLFSDHGISIDKIKSDFSYFLDIPHLTKEIIEQQSDRLISEEYKGQFLHTRKTNGSTGPALNVYYSQDELDWTAAANLYCYDFTGKKYRHREVHLASLFEHLEPNWKERLYGLAKSVAMNRSVVHTKAYDADSIQKLFSAILNAKASQLQGHPSTLFEIASYVQNHIKSPVKLFDTFESTGETLDKRKHDLITQWLPGKIFNRYGNAEFGVVAHSVDRFDELYVFDRLFHLEDYVLPNGAHELVATSLYQKSMPYIRYRTGDLGEVFERDGDLWLRKVQGRVHDRVVINSKEYPTHYLQDVVLLRNEVKEFQAHVGVNNNLNRLRIVLNPGVSDAVRSDLVKYLQDYFGRNLVLEFTSSEHLQRFGHQQKFRHLVKDTK